MPLLQIAIMEEGNRERKGEEGMKKQIERIRALADAWKFAFEHPEEAETWMDQMLEQNA